MTKRSSEQDKKMEEQLKALNVNRQDLQEPPAANDPSPVEEPPSSPGLRVTANGRKLGKHKDPEWGKFTILLKKQTQKKASRLADDLKPPRDLSDLTEELLSKWIQQQEKKEEKQTRKAVG
jgi:hypothetical protein